MANKITVTTVFVFVWYLYLFELTIKMMAMIPNNEAITDE
jgi:hypothetical protein